MAKNIRRMLAMVLVMCMFASALPMQALAAEGDGTVTEGPIAGTTSDGVPTSTIVTTTTTTTDGSNGTPTVTVEIKETSTSISGSNNAGAQVEGTASSSTTTVTTNGNADVVAESSESYIETTTTTENGSSSHYVAEGSDWSKETVSVPLPEGGVTVEVPTTEGTSNTESFGDPAGTQNVIDGKKPGEGDTNYEYTETTVIEASKVTVETTDITFTETPVEKVVDENGNVTQGTNLDYVYSETKPVQGAADNGLVIWVFRGNHTELPKEGEEIVVKEGYEYKYVGPGNTSQFLPVYLYGKSVNGEDPIYEDAEGNKYYIPESQGSAQYDKTFVNGELVELDDSIPGTFSVAQQFTLVDAATGELITAYCADVTTPTEKGYNYYIENLEDATYYTDEQAAMIRTIADNGYWGTASGEKGSLDSMKAALRNAKDENGNSVFSEEELALVNDGMALTATQMAIWTFSNNANEMHFYNMLYTNEGNENGELKTTWASQLVNTKAEKDDAYALLYKLYNHLINLAPTEAPKDEENGKLTSDGTIINADNLVENMSVTVIEKANDHANNQDEDDTNDAYVTNLTFALVVQPSTDNGDDLVVTVVDADGKEIARGRIAGQATEGENVLTPDDNGNYCFKGITMVEGAQHFQLNLSGIQHLKEGVYLYTSEVMEGTSSQTLVGLASGDHAVNVSMDIDFTLNVDDAVVATEHVWHYEGDPSNEHNFNTPVPTNLEPEAAPQVFRLANQNVEEIPEEPVPLAAPVITGDNSGLWIAVVLLSVFAMAAINLFDKKRQHEAF